MKDNDVGTFYSCTLCQTFAPNHVCIITPERPALCGAISWLDGKIAYEISPSGANQPVDKGSVLDKETGEFEGVNKFVRKVFPWRGEQVFALQYHGAPDDLLRMLRMYCAYAPRS